MSSQKVRESLLNSMNRAEIILFQQELASPISRGDRLIRPCFPLPVLEMRPRMSCHFTQQSKTNLQGPRILCIDGSYFNSTQARTAKRLPMRVDRNIYADHSNHSWVLLLQTLGCVSILATRIQLVMLFATVTRMPERSFQAKGLSGVFNVDLVFLRKEP